MKKLLALIAFITLAACSSAPTPVMDLNASPTASPTPTPEPDIEPDMAKAEIPVKKAKSKKKKPIVKKLYDSNDGL